MFKTKHLLAGCAMAAMTLSMTTTAFAQISGDHLKANKGQSFSSASFNDRSATRAAIADFISTQRGDFSGSLELVTDSTYRSKFGQTHMRMHQKINGLRVHGSFVKAAANRNGKLVHLMERTANPSGKITRSGLSAERAIEIATGHNFGAGRSADFFHKAPTGEKVLIARNSGTFEEGYLVENWSQADNRLYHTLIDSRGKIVDNELRTAEDSYNVYPDHPDVDAQTVINGPGAGNAESPIGWLGSGTQRDVHISGNNVSAYLDRDNNNGPDSGGTVVTDGNFLANHNASADPTAGDNQKVAVQNLFYLNNVIHDDLYGHGFVEGTLNFQENNFGNGGAGSDSVNAEAQDGGGTNNANFATPSDGSNPRMQMYIWDWTNPRRDGDLDSDIVWHEYGHGLTWRMIGSMSGAISGAIGEGMSDVLAILHNDEHAVGEYSTGRARGIRSEDYTDYSRTIGDFGGNSVHSDGEIYAAAIWRLKEYAEAEGIDNETIMDWLVDGMNFTGPGPDYMDMRDGILASGATDAATECLVWQAFADYGMGEGSSMRIRGRRATITETFTLPASCNGTGGNISPTADFSQTCTNLSCSFTDNSSDSDGSISSWSWDFGDGASSSAQNPSHSYSSAGTYSVSLTVTDNEGATDTVSSNVTVSDGTGGGLTLTSVIARKVKGKKQWVYNWSEATTDVDIYLDGVVEETVGNTGTYTLITNQKGGGSHTHKVCETGTSICSATVTTTF